MAKQQLIIGEFIGSIPIGYMRTPKKSDKLSYSLINSKELFCGKFVVHSNFLNYFVHRQFG